MAPMRSIVITLFCIGFSVTTFAQDNADTEPDPYSLSLEELMKIPIESASKKEENLFDAPLSSYTITQSDIEKAGSTSIMEALRLSPGIIVREETNGVYDIHIRGFDNILQNSGAYEKTDIITLVMIDNRPVFNNNLGGTFWENLPIDINDVERIEIVRGPSSPLFGPNAVAGVINIITKHVAGDKPQVKATVSYGTPSTTIANTSFLQKVGNVSMGFSANYQNRQRFDTDYYQSSTGKYVSVDTLLKGQSVNPYPDVNLALARWGVNAFAHYKVSETTFWDFTVGTQASETQKVFFSANNTPFTTNKANSYYANLILHLKNLVVRSSYNAGDENINVNVPPGRYTFNVANANLEYNIALGKKYTITPGISYQYVVLSDKKYSDATSTYALLRGDPSITTQAAFVRGDLNFTEKWRVLFGLRADKFSVPDKTYFAYEFATTYKLNENNLVRGAVTRSNSGSFIGTNYANATIPTQIPGYNVSLQGNTNLNLVTINMVELGYRSQLARNLQLDIDAFIQTSDNFTAPVALAPNVIHFQNVPIKATQTGFTFSINYVPNSKMQIRPFITVQQTKTDNFPSSYADASIDPTLTYNSLYHKNTPSFYGGYAVNYGSGKFNVNLNGYYFASHTQYDQFSAVNPSTGDIKGKVLVNLKVSYSITGYLKIFVNGRNTLNSNSREFYGADRIGSLYMIGLSLKVNSSNQ